MTPITDAALDRLQHELRTKSNGHAPGNEHRSEDGGAPAFPVDVLPPVMRRYVEEAAASVPVPPEMIALPMLVMAGGLVGNRAHFQLKRGWYEYPTLYMVVVAGPGKNKSTAIGLARKPVQVIQRDAKKQYDIEYAVFEDERRRWKATPQKERGDEPQPPRMRHVYTTDVTLEALAGMLEKTPGIVISTDELTGWIRRMNQYRQGGDREQYMSIWAGEPMKVDRKGSGSVYVDKPVVGVFGGIQPDVVPTLHSAAQARDGFVERILPFMPDLPPKKWNKAAHVSEDAESGVVALYRTINQLPLVNIEDVGAPGIGIQMSLEAEREWARWSDENNALAAELGGFLGGYYTKLEAHVARIALILHILWNPDDPRPMISAKTMRDAIEVGEYFRGQMNRFLPLLVSGVKTSTKQAGLWGRILRLFDKKIGKSESGNVGNAETRVCMTRRELMGGLGNVKAEELTIELDTYIDHRELTYERVPTATKPVDTYCLTIKPDPSHSESGIPTFPHSYIPTFPYSPESASGDHVVIAINDFSDSHIPPIPGANGHGEPVPAGCGAPESCQKLGSCHVYRETGQCWGAQVREDVAPDSSLNGKGGGPVAERGYPFTDPVFMANHGEMLAKLSEEKAECAARCAALREARGDTPMPSGGKAVIVQHSAIHGRLEDVVREFSVREFQPYAHYPCLVHISGVPPRKREWVTYEATPDNIRYFTIENDAGEVIYDSRQDVPCDMEKWQETYARFEKQRSVLRWR